MAERDTQYQEATADSPGRRPRSLGRKLATLIVSVAILYLVGVGLVSVVPQIFWPERGDLEASVTCTSAVETLERDLLQHASERMTQLDAPTRDHRAFFDGWDRQHRAAEARCGGEDHELWEVLGRFRHRMETSLRRMDQEEGALARRMGGALAHRDPVP